MEHLVHFPGIGFHPLVDPPVQERTTNSPSVHVHAPLAALHLFPRSPSLSALQSTARTILVPMPVHRSSFPPLPIPHRIHEPHARARTTPRPAPGAWRSRHSASVRSKTSRTIPRHRSQTGHPCRDSALKNVERPTPARSSTCCTVISSKLFSCIRSTSASPSASRVRRTLRSTFG
jgi:hypothetical protein